MRADSKIIIIMMMLENKVVKWALKDLSDPLVHDKSQSGRTEWKIVATVYKHGTAIKDYNYDNILIRR